MHEWALAESVALTAAKVAKEEGFSEISKITLKLGELQQKDKGILKFLIKEIVLLKTCVSYFLRITVLYEKFDFSMIAAFAVYKNVRIKFLCKKD